MLPGLMELRFAKPSKQSAYKELPVIMLTGKRREGDIIKGFECGADDM